MKKKHHDVIKKKIKTLEKGVNYYKEVSEQRLQGNKKDKAT